jgi:peptidoglycan/xylan/chitin deacetylase (PgdA/CDA1 family)
VFAYHVVDAGTFEADLQFLATNGYKTLGGDDFLRYLEGTGDVAPRSVVLTFDDGPRNFFEVAFPILKRHGARALAFIAPGLHADAGPDDATDARPMTWQEIAAIHASGLVEFQSHTFESRFVPKWPLEVPLAACDPSIERKRRRPPLSFEADLARSRQELERHLPGVKVDQLAFPMYLGTPAAVQTARDSAFRACYWGLIPGRPVNRRGDSPFYVSRLSDEFLRRLPGTGRITIREMFRARLFRMREGRAWRQRFPTGSK